MNTSPTSLGPTGIDDTLVGANAPTQMRGRIAAVIWTALALSAFGIFGTWALNDGGYAPEQWLPGTLVILGLLCVALSSANMRARLRAAPTAPLLLGLYAIWSYASIIWAQVQGDAWDGANRTLLYFAVYVLFAGLPLGERARSLLVGCWGIAIATLAGVEIVAAASAPRPQGHFVLGRLASPITYSNANAALFLFAFLSLHVLATRRDAHPAFRVGASGLCAVLLGAALLSESRGSLIALSLTLLIYLTFCRNFLRALAQLAVVGLAVGVSVPQLLAVYSAVVGGRGYDPALRSARGWLVASVLIASAGSALLTLIDRRHRIPERVCIQIRHATVATAIVAAVAAALVFLVVGHPVAEARRAWDDFATNKKSPPGTIHIVSGVGTSRYDVWRIALQQFAAHPLGGIGADNYIVGYLKHRRTTETARYPESLELRALSETGIVGAILFFGFLGAAARRATAVRSGSGATVVLACLVSCGYWILHASIDWLWEFPALTAPALAFLGLAAGAGVPAWREGRPGQWARRMRGAIIVSAAALATVATAAALAAPWVAVRQRNEAVAVAAANPERAYALLRAAAKWNRLSDDAALTEAALAANVADRTRERRALLAALERNSSNWYAYFMLGIVDGQRHQLAAARKELAQARRLSPLDPVILYAQRRLEWGTPLSERQVARIFELTTRTLRGVVQR